MKKIEIKKSLDFNAITIFFICCVAIMGQPNGIYLLFPKINLVIGATVLAAVVASILFLVKIHYKLSVFFWKFVFFIMLYWIYSLISITFSADKQFALNMAISFFFKILLFFSIVALCSTPLCLKYFLKTTIFFGTFFSFTGIFLTILFIFRIVKPTTEIGEVQLANSLSYDQLLEYYQYLGFIRSSSDIFDIIFPRLQSFFIEPGFFAFFIELSLFSTLAYYYQYSKKRISIKLSIALQIIALVLSLSLGGIVFIILAYLFFKIIINNTKINSIFFLKILLYILLSCVIILFLSQFQLINELFKIFVLERFKTDYGTSSASARTDSFDLGIKLIKDYFIFGCGINQTRIITGGIGLNNSYLTVFAETGIIGVSIILLAIKQIFRCIFLIIQSSKKNSNKKYAISGMAIVSGFIAMLLHTIIIDAFTCFHFWIMLSLVFAYFQIYIQPILNEEQL